MATKKLVRKPSTTKTSSNSNQVGLNSSQVSQLKGMKGIDQKALSNYEASGSVVGGRNNPSGRGRETAITPERLTPTEVAEIPTAPIVPNVGDLAGAGNTGLATMLSGLGYTQDSDGLFVAPKDMAGTSADMSGQANAFNNYLGASAANAPVNQEDIYNKTLRQSGVNDAQRQVNQYTAQLNAIVAKSQAEQLGLEGQGRGVTESIIGGQQAQINREAAIAALPVQAQLAAAQGNLEFAQKQMDTLFSLRVADATAKYNYKSNLISSVYNFATTIEQSRLNALKTKEDRAYSEKQQSIAEAKNIAMQAMEYGQSGLASRLMNLDQNSPTYSQDVSKAITELRKPAPPGDGAPKVVSVNGVDSIWNPTTGKFEAITLDGASNANEAIADELATKITNIKGLTNHSGLNSAVGAVGLGRVGISDAFGAKDEFIGKVEQLVSQEFLDTLISTKAKGATFGALTKPEQDALTNAATAIGQWRMTDKETGKTTGYDIDEQSFKRELNTLVTLAQKAESKARGYDVTKVPTYDSIFIDSLHQDFLKQTMTQDVSNFY